MLSLLQYSGSSDEDGDTSLNTAKKSTSDPETKINPKYSFKSQLAVCAAPEVVPTGLDADQMHINLDTTELSYNPKFDVLFAPILGPVNPFKTQQQSVDRNMLSGHIEQAHVSEFQFENQRRTFTSYGYALDPSITNDGQIKVVGSTEEGKDVDSVKTVFETSKIRPLDKRKRKKNDDPGDVDGFLGPWGGFVDEQKVAKPTEEEQAELDEITSKKNKKGKILQFVYLTYIIFKYFSIT